MSEVDSESRPMVILTGMSGAGRSTTANVLEDLGWYVIDNLPPQMLGQLDELLSDVRRRAQPDVPPLAAVVDVRSRGWFVELSSEVRRLAGRGVRPTLIFLDATDEALVRRFESVRRPHPLQGEGRLLDGIVREREMLVGLRSDADMIIDTSGLNVHALTAKITSIFAQPTAAQIR
ncbi:MAG TPA: RNase adapter RapZ, partial [Candidatus Lustribacter sp.]|nr:RNase adapter RapZ [Candidatus Lustribacter sp.]